MTLEITLLVHLIGDHTGLEGCNDVWPKSNTGPFPYVDLFCFLQGLILRPHLLSPS